MKLANKSKYRHPDRGEITGYEDEHYILLEIPFRFPQEDDKGKSKKSKGPDSESGVKTLESKSDSSWTELAQTEIKHHFDKCKKYNDKLVKLLTSSIPELKHLQTYHLLQTGSKEDYWYETRIDIGRLKMTDGTKERSLRELSSKTRLELLSDTLGSYQTLMANRVASTMKNSMIIGFSKKTYDLSSEDFPSIFLQIVEIDDLDNHPNRDQIEVDPHYLQAKKAFTAQFSKYLMYHSKLRAMHDIGYEEANNRAIEIKTKTQRMQSEINHLIRQSQKLMREKASSSSLWYLKDTRQVADYDESLLYNASIYFSHITELLQTITNAIYMTREHTYNLNKSATSLALEPVPNPLTLEKTEHISLNEEFNRFSDQVTHSFESMKLDIEATQTSLRNTVEVLKTFLEGKQRISSTQSGKTLGLLTVVFACFVFIDMISNYFIYFLESERNISQMAETVIALIVTLWPSLIMFVLLYFVFLKKIWD